MAFLNLCKQLTRLIRVDANLLSNVPNVTTDHALSISGPLLCQEVNWRVGGYKIKI